MHVQDGISKGLGLVELVRGRETAYLGQIEFWGLLMFQAKAYLTQ